MYTYTITSFKKSFHPDSIQSAWDLIDISDLPFEKVKSINWEEYSYKPEVYFKIAHYNNGLLVMFKVEETGVKATEIKDNGPVYNDSCVEFFVDPIGDGSYYNFEFNVIGTLLLGHGHQRHCRNMAPEQILKSIYRFSSLGNHPVNIDKKISWELSVFIPFTAFFMHQIHTFEDLRPKGNIHKCGNLLKVPHYVTWNPILSEKPDFHRPEYFGTFKVL